VNNSEQELQTYKRENQGLQKQLTTAKTMVACLEEKLATLENCTAPPLKVTVMANKFFGIGGIDSVKINFEKPRQNKSEECDEPEFDKKQMTSPSIRN